MIENLTVSILDKIPGGFTIEELIRLTGILGIHPDLHVEDDINVKIYPFIDCIRVVITSFAIKYLQIVIYPDNKYIDNQNLRSTKVKLGVGIKWVYSQSTEAEKKGYKFLEAYAYKDDSGTTDLWSGYIVWGKYGYLLHEDSKREFQNLMEMLKRTETSIHELINDEDGLKIWIEEGFPWKANFDLAKGSESWRILENCIQKKSQN